MEEHKDYIGHDRKQCLVQRRVVPEDYVLHMALENAAGAGAAEDAEDAVTKENETLLALSAKTGAIVKEAVGRMWAPKPESVPVRHPDGTISPVLVGPSVCSRTLSLADAPEKEGSPHPCGDCIPTPPWCLPAHTPVVPADFDYSQPFLMTNSVFLKRYSPSNANPIFHENTFQRTERMKKFLKCATQQTTINVSVASLHSCG